MYFSSCNWLDAFAGCYHQQELVHEREQVEEELCCDGEEDSNGKV